MRGKFNLKKACKDVQNSVTKLEFVQICLDFI